MDVDSYSYNRSENRPVNRNLMDTIQDMRLDLYKLRNKLSIEKSLLNQRKQDILGQDHLCSKNKTFPWPEDNSQPERNTVKNKEITLNKDYLRDIESNCDKELDKLGVYISNIHMLKNVWINMKKSETNKRNLPKPKDSMQEHWKSTEKRPYPKGKIFYVDSDLY